MKKVVSLVVLAFSLLLSVAGATSADSGIIMLVYPTGSMYGEAVKAGVSTAPETWPWGTTHNPYAEVNIGLESPNGLLYSDIRLIGQHDTECFNGKIWVNPGQTFKIRSGYISGLYGGSWMVPDESVTISLWQDNQNPQIITLEKRNIGDWPIIASELSGDWNFNINFQQTVPEPGSLLALGSGLIGLVGFGLRRRQ